MVEQAIGRLQLTNNSKMQPDKNEHRIGQIHLPVSLLGQKFNFIHQIYVLEYLPCPEEIPILHVQDFG
jgi:hypothetical protein